MPGGRRQVILLLQLANEASGLIFIPTLSCWQKGGALLEEMRQLVRFWHDGRVDDVSQEAVRINILNKTTRARAADILRRTFVPRFVEGTPPNAWKLLRSLESLDAPLVRPVYYWISAKSESLIQDFCTEFLFSRVKTVRTESALMMCLFGFAQKSASLVRRPAP